MVTLACIAFPFLSHCVLHAYGVTLLFFFQPIAAACSHFLSISNYYFDYCPAERANHLNGNRFRRPFYLLPVSRFGHLCWRCVPLDSFELRTPSTVQCRSLTNSPNIRWTKRTNQRRRRRRRKIHRNGVCGVIVSARIFVQ